MKLAFYRRRCKHKSKGAKAIILMVLMTQLKAWRFLLSFPPQPIKKAFKTHSHSRCRSNFHSTKCWDSPLKVSFYVFPFPSTFTSSKLSRWKLQNGKLLRATSHKKNYKNCWQKILRYFIVAMKVFHLETCSCCCSKRLPAYLSHNCKMST